MKFELRAEMDIVAAPGTLRVTLRPNRPAILMHVGVVVVGVALTYLTRNVRLPPMVIFLGFVLVAWFSFAVSETIEIDDQRLVIRTKNLGWTRTSEYGVSKCTDFRANERQSWIFSSALVFKFKGLPVTFGHYMSADQASEVIQELKRNIPQAGDQLLMRTDFTTLSLS